MFFFVGKNDVFLLLIAKRTLIDLTSFLTPFLIMSILTIAVGCVILAKIVPNDP